MMKKSTFTPMQIAGILKEFDGGKKVPKKSPGSMVSAGRLCIPGDDATAVWKPRS